MTLTQERFESWLGAFGKAWETSDAQKFAALFAPDALYYWTPFEEPKRGPAEIASAFSGAIAKQSDIEFGARILYVQAQLGAAHWSCAFTRKTTGQRVHVDGILVVQMDDDGFARSFREWWHTDEK